MNGLYFWPEFCRHFPLEVLGLLGLNWGQFVVSVGRCPRLQAGGLLCGVAERGPGLAGEIASVARRKGLYYLAHLSLTLELAADVSFRDDARKKGRIEV